MSDPCLFRGCSAAAEFQIFYEPIVEYEVLCRKHRVFIDSLHQFYKNQDSKEIELFYRRLTGYLLPEIFDDGHKWAAQVRVCLYCKKIDYIDFRVDGTIIIDRVTDLYFGSRSIEGICNACHHTKTKMQEKYDNDGWDSRYTVCYENHKWIARARY